MSYEPDMPASRPAKSGAVTAVAVINFVLGGLNLLCGFAALAGGALFSSVAGSDQFKKAMQEAQKKQGMDPAQAQQIAQITENPDKVGGLVMIVAAVVILIGVLLIVAGVGVVMRRSWGRILTMILAVLWVVSNIVPSFNLVGLVIAVAYTILVFVILLNKKFAAEFA